MMIDAFTLVIIVTSALLGSTAQVLLKMGLMNEKLNLYLNVIEYIFKPKIFTGALLYAIAFFLWLVVLSRLELSRAYPFLALNFILVEILSFFLLGESITKGKIIGNTLIISGILVISLVR